MKAAVLCEHFEDHTLCPEGYIQWHAWAEEMAKTHRQEKCAGCGLFAIWVPRKSALRSKAASQWPSRKEAR